MADITITIPDNLLSEVIAALSLWENDAKALDDTYDSLPDAEKLATLFLAEAKARTANVRRVKAEADARSKVPPVAIEKRRR